MISVGRSGDVVIYNDDSNVKYDGVVEKPMEIVRTFPNCEKNIVHSP